MSLSGGVHGSDTEWEIEIIRKLTCQHPSAIVDELLFSLLVFILPAQDLEYVEHADPAYEGHKEDEQYG